MCVCVHLPLCFCRAVSYLRPRTADGSIFGFPRRDIILNYLRICRTRTSQELETCVCVCVCIKWGGNTLRVNYFTESTCVCLRVCTPGEELISTYE